MNDINGNETVAIVDRLSKAREATRTDRWLSSPTAPLYFETAEGGKRPNFKHPEFVKKLKKQSQQARENYKSAKVHVGISPIYG